MGYKVLTQIVLVIFALVVIFSYIQPTFEQISKTQDELYQYTDTVAKAEEFNRLLAELIAIENSFSPQDMAALDKFLPSAVDAAQVMRDLEALDDADDDVTITSIESATFVANQGGNKVVIEGGGVDTYSFGYQDFNMEIEASYDDFKSFMQTVEANAYPVEVVTLDISSNSNNSNGNNNAQAITNPDDLMNLSIVLRVYALVKN